jgi:hypothetical protein
MRSSGGKSRAVWLLACVCGLVVVLELVWPSEEQIVPPTPARAPIDPNPAGNGDPVGAWTSAILARPLFNPTRRPDTTPASEVATERRGEPPRLAGILVSADRSQAIFAPADGKDRSIVAVEGSVIGAWKVTAIRAGEVQLSGPDGTRIVRPSYANVAAASPPPVSPPPPAGGDSLLPPAPADTRPFNSVAEPSGAAILSNMLRSQAARSTQ